jgi:hypothetical protein
VSSRLLGDFGDQVLEEFGPVDLAVLSSVIALTE